VRCQAASVPDQRGFATKPELARVMLERALDAGVPTGWVTADKVYGGSPALRGWLESRQLPYVLAVKATEPLPPGCGSPTTAARLVERIPPHGWLRLSAGLGAKGRRWYGWSRLPLLRLVRVAGTRWRVEEAFQAGKGLCGLDQHQVHRWRSWYQWVTLAMLAYAFPVVAAVTERDRHPPLLGSFP
jgi:SRSO17 transposase